MDPFLIQGKIPGQYEDWYEQVKHVGYSNAVCELSFRYRKKFASWKNIRVHNSHAWFHFLPNTDWKNQSKGVYSESNTVVSL